MKELSTPPGMDLINDAIAIHWPPSHSSHPLTLRWLKCLESLLLIASLLMQRHAPPAAGFWFHPDGSGIKSNGAATVAVAPACRQWVAIKRSYRLTNIGESVSQRESRQNMALNK